MRDEASRLRIRLGVTGGIALLALASGYFASGGLGTEWAVNTGGLVLGYVLPAQWIERPADVGRRWKGLLAVFVLATLAWDGATAWAGMRAFLSEWWLVYSSGPGVLFGLGALHGVLVERISRATGGDPGPEEPVRPTAHEGTDGTFAWAFRWSLRGAGFVGGLFFVVSGIQTLATGGRLLDHLGPTLAMTAIGATVGGLAGPLVGGGLARRRDRRKKEADEPPE